MAKLGRLNKIQKLAARAYGDGDFSHVKTTEESQDVGDGLFSFIMRELADDGGPMDGETALNRMHGARRDIDSVISALEQEFPGFRD